MEENKLLDPTLYINRELSLLAFNYRVLRQATFDDVPLLERLRYLCIASSNLDEFFEIRVSSVKQLASAEVVQAAPDDIHPQELLNRISAQAHDLVNEQYHLLNEVLIPLLDQENIRFLKRDHWNQQQQEWIKAYFDSELDPMLSPMGLDPAHPFPRILNKSLNFFVTLKGKDAFGRERNMAILQAPRSLPRLIKIPAEHGSGPNDFVFLSSIIHAHIESIFSGLRVTGCYQFRVTRNSDLFVDDEEVDDLLSAVEGELPSRRYGDAVRLETADNCTDEINRYLLEQFELNEDDLYKCNGPVNLNRLMALPDMVERPELNFPPFSASIPKAISRHGDDIFKAIRKGDILLHQPFESFVPVIDFLRQAATDPKVMAIKQTLYRTGEQSEITKALIKAARAGKEVTVVVELRARFDEEANIALAHQLQEAGAHVVYGVVGFKTHAKMIQVVRREDDMLRHYIHLGTGNYHARTAKIYTDYSLLTCDEKMAADVNQIFLQLTSLGRSKKLNKMLQSPFTLFTGMIERIVRETENAKKGRPAHIIAKMNALVEPQVIRALYEASMAGVKIDLIIRGICCLRPGIPGVSDNIRVVSIIGRFLEHPRVYYFANNDKPEVYGSSADWMGRNLHKRVESCFPVEAKGNKDRIISELQLYLRDNKQAWELQSDSSYTHVEPAEGDEVISAQKQLLDEFASWD